MDNQTFDSVAGPKKKTLQLPLTILMAVLIGTVALQALQLNSLTRAIKSGASIQNASQGTGSFLSRVKSQVGGCGG